MDADNGGEWMTAEELAVAGAALSALLAGDAETLACLDAKAREILRTLLDQLDAICSVRTEELPQA